MEFSVSVGLELAALDESSIRLPRPFRGLVNHLRNRTRIQDPCRRPGKAIALSEWKSIGATEFLISAYLANHGIGCHRLPVRDPGSNPSIDTGPSRFPHSRGPSPVSEPPNSVRSATVPPTPLRYSALTRARTSSHEGRNTFLRDRERRLGSASRRGALGSVGRSIGALVLRQRRTGPRRSSFPLHLEISAPAGGDTSAGSQSDQIPKSPSSGNLPAQSWGQWSRNSNDYSRCGPAKSHAPGEQPAHGD